MKTNKKIICTLLVFCMILCIFPVSIFVSASYLPAVGISSGKVYFIMNVNSGKCFDVSSGNTANGSDVSQFTYTPSCQWQQWRLTYCGNGNYKIMDMHSGKLLSIASSSSEDYANAHIWQDDGTSGQYFRIRQNNDGTYTFLSQCSGYTKALGVYQEGTGNGNTIVQQTGDNGSANQKYYIFVSNSTTYNIQNVNSGKCLDVSNGSIENWSHVSQFQLTPTTPWQKWRIVYVGDGDYMIIDSHSGKMLTINYDSALGLYCAFVSEGASNSRRFRITKNSDGTYTFLTKYSNYTKALCVLNNGTQNGDIICQETYNSSSNNQKFNIFLSQNTYHIKNFNSNKCLDVSGGNTANGSDVAQYTFTPNCEWQRWQINYCGNGDYTITDMNSGKLLSVEGSSSAINANIWIWQSDGTAGQYFRIRSNADGTVTFLTKASNYTKAIGIYASGYDNGDTVVQQSNDNGSENQKFVLVNTSVRLYLVASGGTHDNFNSSDESGRTTYGHAWLKILNTSDININGVGHYPYTIKHNEAITIGRWGDFSSPGLKYEHNGIWYNLENKKMREDGDFINNVATFIDISLSQLDFISQKAINTYDEYDLEGNNCVDFAVQCWNQVSNIDIDISTLIFKKLNYDAACPAKLEDKIENDFQYISDISYFTENYFGYYNGQSFYIPED